MFPAQEGVWITGAWPRLRWHPMSPASHPCVTNAFLLSVGSIQ